MLLPVLGAAELDAPTHGREQIRWTSGAGCREHGYTRAGIPRPRREQGRRPTHAHARVADRSTGLREPGPLDQEGRGIARNAVGGVGHRFLGAPNTQGVCRSTTTILIPGQLELDDRTLEHLAPPPVLLALACLRFDSWVGGWVGLQVTQAYIRMRLRVNGWAGSATRLKL
jgi:hypothetical protein